MLAVAGSSKSMLVSSSPWIGDKVCLELVEVDIERPVKSERGRD